MRVLVTGGAGFIGSHLVERLLADGHFVRVLDDFSTGKRGNLELVSAGAPAGCFELIEGSLVDLDTCRRAVEGVDGVLHQAALPSVPRSVRDPLGSNAANVDGTLNLLVAARDAKVRRMVQASSSSVYGNSPTLPKHEGMPTNPRSPYALTKLAGEVYARLFFELYGLETVCLRYFNVFGPRQDPSSQYAAVIPKFVFALLDGNPPEIHGDGGQTRDFTYIANVVDANLRALEAPKAAGEAMNVAAGTRTSLLEMLAHIQQILGTSIAPKHVESRAGDVRDSLADLTKVSQLTGYAPKIGLREGLERYVAWARSVRDA
ncbi:MAG: SDR family oxidoreductase [bacterium]